jgi:hypothetical protein
MTIRREYRLSLPSMASRHTIRREYRLSLPSMASRHTIRPEYKRRDSPSFKRH